MDVVSTHFTEDIPVEKVSFAMCCVHIATTLYRRISSSLSESEFHISLSDTYFATSQTCWCGLSVPLAILGNICIEREFNAQQF